jgi:hypothetical protein
MDFSCIMPTRGRPHLLKQCIHSFMSKASRPKLVEFWLAFDIDDKSNNEIDDYVCRTGYNVKYIKVHRTDWFHRDYHNRLLKLCQGKYIIGLNDECEIVQNQWDDILVHEIENFVADKIDRIAYVYINDSTHQGNNLFANTGCCFPIFTREACQAAGCYIPDEVPMWGGDLVVYHIYRSLKEYRVLDIQKKLQILHHSHHNSTRGEDDQGRRIRGIPFLPVNTNMYIDRLNSRISSTKPKVITEYIDPCFFPINLESVVTATTARPFMADKPFETIRFKGIGIVKYQNVPFRVIDYANSTKNAIALYAPYGTTSRSYPTMTSIPCGKRATKVHLLGMVAGWGYQGGSPGSNESRTTSINVEINYSNGTKEVFELKNGEHFTDFTRILPIPGSVLVDTSMEGNPIRMLTLNLTKSRTIKNIQLSKGDGDITCPILFAITLEDETDPEISYI